MRMFDENPKVLSWSSEETIVGYISPIDGKPHRYFPDFRVRVMSSDGSQVDYLIEIKPKSQTIEPKMPKNPRSKRRYLRELQTWAVNNAKWESAEEWCRRNNHVFKVFTEETIGFKYHSKKRSKAG